MELLTEQMTVGFDLSAVKRGDLFWGRHRTWGKGKAGFVTAVTGEQLTVQYHPGIGNVTNHFHVPVSEVVDGQWEIRWSSDMAEIYEYGILPDKEPEEPVSPVEPVDPDGPEFPELPGESGGPDGPEGTGTPAETGIPEETDRTEGTEDMEGTGGGGGGDPGRTDL